MKRVFKLRCDEIGKMHTKFTLFDPDHANCGTIVILTQDIANLVYHSWNGRVDWNERARRSFERIFPPEKEAGSEESTPSRPS